MKRSRKTARRSIVDRCADLEARTSMEPLFPIDDLGVPQCVLARFAAVINSRPILRRHIAELAPAPVVAHASADARSSVDAFARSRPGPSAHRERLKPVRAAHPVELLLE